MAEEGVSESSLHDLARLAAAYKAGDKTLRRNVGKALREAVRPISAGVIHGAEDQFPAHGGLRARIAAARPGSALSLGGQSPKVSISLKVREGYDLAAIDRSGVIRHRVYGRGPWVSQDIHAKGAFSNEFERQGPHARELLSKAIEQALATISREA